MNFNLIGKRLCQIGLNPTTAFQKGLLHCYFAVLPTNFIGS